MAKMALIVLLSIALVMSGGCTTTRLVPTGNAAELLEEGDQVRLTLRTGEVRRLKLQSIETDALIGKELRTAGNFDNAVRIPLADVEYIEHRQLSWARTGGAVLGTVAAFVVVGLAALAVALQDTE
jgi:hypothetical protein